jgi:hypothetical protein
VRVRERGGTGEGMLADLLKKEKATVLRKWLGHVLETYPEDASRFLKSEKNPFANPVGSAIGEGLEGIFDELLEDAPSASLAPFLDKLIRIRSVQEFSPSAAISFVFQLKPVLREVLKKEMLKQPLHEEWVAFTSRIDRLALLAFDTYVQCREELFELRVGELRRHRDAAVRVLERTQRISEEIPPGEKP